MAPQPRIKLDKKEVKKGDIVALHGTPVASRAAKTEAPAPAPAAKTALSPQAAWPFPTGAKP